MATPLHEEFIPRVAAPEIETLREFFTVVEAYLETGRKLKKPAQPLSSPKLVPILCALARRHKFPLTGPSEPSYLILQQEGRPPLVFQRYMGSHSLITQTFILAPYLALELSLYYSRRRRRIYCCEVLVYDAHLSRVSLPHRSSEISLGECPGLPHQAPSQGEFLSPYWFSLEDEEAKELLCASWARILQGQKWTGRSVPQQTSVAPVYANWSEYDTWIRTLVRRESGAGKRVELVRLAVPRAEETWPYHAR